MEPLFFLALLVFLVLFLLRGLGRPNPPCPACGMPRSLAEEVRLGCRHCPRVAFRACPFDPRKGLWRQRR
ncbi:hypothetical protein [Thermus oshimai]|uniref:hypothetical protein n=1 Tax=Thermus oshimai TaxID=56957 RepID=UPI0002F2886A|nr:hypothetical protein [Thermus oshimai]